MAAGEIMVSVATIIAIVLGPFLAVLVTRKNDDRRANRIRKLDIFRTLMRTRRMPVHVDHVGALNLVEVEFVDRQKVIDAWKAYLANLSEEFPPIEQKEKFDAASRKRDSLLTKLIYEISQVMNIKVEQLDILEGNYIPQGWLDDDWEQKLVRRHLVHVLSGKSAILIRQDQALKDYNPYSPPPDDNPN